MSLIGTTHSRRHFCALVNTDEDAELALRDDFYSRCAGLCHADIAALSQRLQVSYRTIAGYKYGLGFPASFGRAIAIMRWIDDGKPMIRTSAMRQDAGLS